MGLQETWRPSPLSALRHFLGGSSHHVGIFRWTVVWERGFCPTSKLGPISNPFRAHFLNAFDTVDTFWVSKNMETLTTLGTASLGSIVLLTGTFEHCSQARRLRTVGGLLSGRLEIRNRKSNSPSFPWGGGALEKSKIINTKKYKIPHPPPLPSILGLQGVLGGDL